MKWGITDLSLYLMGKKFRVRMDNNPLIYFTTSPNLDAMKHQWIGEVAPYNFSVEYQKGKLNVVVDMLSRMTSRLNEKETDSYLQTVEANTLADFEADVQDEPPSQDNEGEYESPWPPLGPSGRKEVPKLGEVEMLSSEAVQALFDGITMGTNRCAEREWDQSFVIDREWDDINLGVRAARLMTPMHVINWVEAQTETTNGTHKRNPRWQSSPQDCRQADSVRRSPVSETPSLGCPRHHQVIHRAPGTSQESDRWLL